MRTETAPVPARVQEGSFSYRGMSRFVASVFVGILGLIVGLAVTLVGPTTAAHASDEGALSSLVNEARANSGLSPLDRNSAMDQVALSWAHSMAAAGELKHNPSFQDQIPGDWTGAAENIATGQSDAQAVHTAWMKSSGHRANILGEYTDIGIAFISASGTTWSVEVFGEYSSSESGNGADQTALPNSPSPSPSNSQELATATPGPSPSAKQTADPTPKATATAKAQSATDMAAKDKLAKDRLAKDKADKGKATKDKATIDKQDAAAAAAGSASPDPTATPESLAAAALSADSAVESEIRDPITFRRLAAENNFGQFTGSPAQVAALGFGTLLVAIAATFNLWTPARRWWIAGVLRRDV